MRRERSGQRESGLGKSGEKGAVTLRREARPNRALTVRQCAESESVIDNSTGLIRGLERKATLMISKISVSPEMAVV